MDNYEKTLYRVINDTTEGALKWNAESPESYRQIIVNPDRVIRCYSAQMNLKGKTFPLLFVEKKTLRFDEVGETSESVSFELYVLDDSDRLIFPIYDGLVDRDDLWRLANVISETSTSANAFFEALLDSSEA